MNDFSVKKFGTFGSVVAAALALVLVAALLWLLIEANVPPPTSSTHKIAADIGFEAVTVGSKQSDKKPTWRLRRSRHYFRPKAVTFEATNGPVKVYAAPVSLAYRKRDRDHIEQLKKEFAAGRVPKEVVAQSDGNSGTLNLPDSHPDFAAIVHFLVLVRSPNENQVTLTVSYKR